MLDNRSHMDSYRQVISTLLRLIFATLLLSSFAFADAPLEVGWRNGRLSVSARDVQFSQVLREIGRQTGTEMRGVDTLQGRVSVQFSGVSLADSLQNLLSGCGYALINKTSGGDGASHLLLVILEERAAASPRGAAIRVEAQGVPDGSASPQPYHSAQTASLAVSQKLAALNTSAQQGDQETLRKAVLDSDPVVQASAFQALAGQDKNAAVAALLEAVRSDQPSTRLEALQLLNQSGNADEETVLSALGDGVKDVDPTIRLYSVQAVATRGGPEAMGYLRQALGDPNHSFRAIVISAAAQNDEMRPLVNEVLSDPDESMSSLAALLLQ